MVTLEHKQPVLRLTPEQAPDPDAPLRAQIAYWHARCQGLLQTERKLSNLAAQYLARAEVAEGKLAARSR